MKVVYTNSSGDELDMSKGNIRAVTVNGVSTEVEINSIENGLRDGSSYISERLGVREIKLKLATFGDYDISRTVIKKIFRTKEEGILSFCFNNGTIKRIGCRLQKIEDDLNENTDVIIINLLSLTPVFESDSQQTYLIYGEIKLLEFDLEFSDDFEFGNIKNDKSLKITNSGSGTGCIITIEVSLPLKSIKIIQNETKKYIKLNGNYSSGDVITVDMRSGYKNVTLYNGKTTENIISDFEWGSEFFQIPPGNSRYYIVSDDDLTGSNVTLSFAEKYEGV